MSDLDRRVDGDVDADADADVDEKDRSDVEDDDTTAVSGRTSHLSFEQQAHEHIARMDKKNGKKLDDDSSSQH